MDPDIQVQVYCAVLWFDVPIIQNLQPPLCQPSNTIVLNRSTNTLYPWLQPPIHYPIVQDMEEKFQHLKDREGNAIAALRYNKGL